MQHVTGIPELIVNTSKYLDHIVYCMNSSLVCDDCVGNTEKLCLGPSGCICVGSCLPVRDTITPWNSTAAPLAMNMKSNTASLLMCIPLVAMMLVLVVPFAKLRVCRPSRKQKPPTNTSHMNISLTAWKEHRDRTIPPPISTALHTPAMPYVL